jgi:hypothetical protein
MALTKEWADQAMARILDRGQSVEGLAEELLGHWEFDLFARRPAPALIVEGTLVPTDLDLVSVLSALVPRGPVLNLPEYRGRRPQVAREGERVVSKENRHGKLAAIVANKEVFSFSVRIVDANVVVSATDDGEEDRVGAYRSFMVVDIDGKWHDGWKRIEFMPNRKENEFFTKNRLWTDSAIVFQNFVHPNRWTSFYGQFYLCTKLLMDRLAAEASWLRAECKRLVAAGVRLEEKPRAERGVTEKGGTTTEKVNAFECEVDAPWRGKFEPLPKTVEALVGAKDRARTISYSTNPKLLVPVRAAELAFVNAGKEEAGMPHWMKGASWAHGVVAKGERTAWDRIVLPGRDGFALRHRTYEKTERVAVSTVSAVSTE